MAYDMVEERYIGTMGRGAEQDILPTCGNRTIEDKAEIPIASARISSSMVLCQLASCEASA